MAKRKKLYGAAAAAHAKKRGKRRASRRRTAVAAPAAPKRRVRRARRARVVRSAPRRSVRRRLHSVKAYTPRRHRRTWTAHAHKRQWRVRQHMSNPFGFGHPGQAAVEGLVAAGIILGGLLVVGIVNRQMAKIPALASGNLNLAGKLAIALGGAMGAMYLAKKGYLSKGNSVALAGVSFVPLALGALTKVMPSAAAQISLSDEGEPGRGEMGDVIQHGVLHAELRDEHEAMAAELQAELREEIEAEDTASY